MEIPFYRISEAYVSSVCEDVEGRNINRAERYIRNNYSYLIGKKLSDGTIITPRYLTQEIRSVIPNSRIAKCRFLEGVSRIYFKEILNRKNPQKRSGLLNRCLKIIEKEPNNFDSNLNGLSYDDIVDRFFHILTKNAENDRRYFENKRYEINPRYEIRKIATFEDAKQYSKYVDWCICNDESMYDSYTNGNEGMFYFCLSKGFEQEERIVGNGCPLDKYGLSMIAVCVNEDGSLNSCTIRWNHEHGGNDNMMDTKEISNLLLQRNRINY